MYTRRWLLRTNHLVSKDPDGSEICAIASAWLRYQADKDEADWWAADLVIDWALDDQLDALWRIVVAVCARVDENDVSRISDIGAGPLEDMLCKFGDAAMDLIEPAVADNPTLLKALAAVWAWDQPVWPRVDRVLAEYGQEPLE